MKFSRLDEWFERTADRTTYQLGRWFFVLVSFVSLVMWVAYGIIQIPEWFTAQAWNFPLNTLTTVGEWFMEGLVLAAANRVQRTNIHMMKQISIMEQQNLQMEREHGEMLARIITLTSEVHRVNLDQNRELKRVKIMSQAMMDRLDPVMIVQMSEERKKVQGL